MSKDADETIVHFYYSDFRIVIAPPVILGLVDALNTMIIQMNKVTQMMATMQPKEKEQAPPAPHPEVVKVPPPAALPTKKIKFTGDIVNIEIWVPRNVCLLLHIY